jgi:hypothetical protein
MQGRHPPKMVYLNPGLLVLVVLQAGTLTSGTITGDKTDKYAKGCHNHQSIDRNAPAPAGSSSSSKKHTV